MQVVKRQFSQHFRRKVGNGLIRSAPYSGSNDHDENIFEYPLHRGIKIKNISMQYERG
jgi:hypothetical protein